jgi:hypothetical protein
MATAYCKVEKIRLERDDSRWERCDARDSDAKGGKKNTCSKCTGYKLEGQKKKGRKK